MRYIIRMSSRGDRTRKALHEAAVTLFAQRGFHGVSVPDLAAAAGLGAASLYRHYVSKEALVNAVIRDRRAVLADEVWADFDHAQPVRLAFRALWARLTALASSRTEDLVFLELHHHDDYLEPATVRAMQASTFSPLVRLLERGQREGVVRPGDVTLFIAALGGLFVGCFKAGLKKGRLVSTSPLEAAEPLAWAAVQA